jgi:hypothetical protein
MSDIALLTNRMSNKLLLAMNDLNRVKKNITEINKIIGKPRISYEYKNYEYKNDKDDKNDKDERQESPRAGIRGNQRNMSQNIWISSLRNRHIF